jgi:hypothetical protein
LQRHIYNIRKWKLAYLDATPEQPADFDSSHRRWGQGTVQITLHPCRKNLLKIDYQRMGD